MNTPGKMKLYANLQEVSLIQVNLLKTKLYQTKLLMSEQSTALLI